MELIIGELPGCVDLIVNGGFELAIGWDLPLTEWSADCTSSMAHTGTRSIRVGTVDPADNLKSYSSARHTVAIPEDPLTATLRFYVYPFSGRAWAAEASTGASLELALLGGPAYDLHYLYIDDQYGQRIGGS